MCNSFLTIFASVYSKLLFTKTAVNDKAKKYITKRKENLFAQQPVAVSIYPQSPCENINPCVITFSKIFLFFEIFWKNSLFKFLFKKKFSYNLICDRRFLNYQLSPISPNQCCVKKYQHSSELSTRINNTCALPSCLIRIPKSLVSDEKIPTKIPRAASSDSAPKRSRWRHSRHTLERCVFFQQNLSSLACSKRFCDTSAVASSLIQREWTKIRSENRLRICGTRLRWSVGPCPNQSRRK